MPNPFARSLAVAAATQQRVAGVTVVYEAAGGRRCGARAVIGRAEYETEDLEQIRTAHRLVDFLIIADELKDEQGRITPQAGDVIQSDHETQGGRYQVVRLPGVAAFEPGDSYGIRLRIHTQRVKS